MYARVLRHMGLHRRSGLLAHRHRLSLSRLRTHVHPHSNLETLRIPSNTSQLLTHQPHRFPLQPPYRSRQLRDVFHRPFRFSHPLSNHSRRRRLKSLDLMVRYPFRLFLCGPVSRIDLESRSDAAGRYRAQSMGSRLVCFRLLRFLWSIGGSATALCNRAQVDKEES